MSKSYIRNGEFAYGGMVGAVTPRPLPCPRRIYVSRPLTTDDCDWLEIKTLHRIKEESGVLLRGIRQDAVPQVHNVTRLARFLNNF